MSAWHPQQYRREALEQGADRKIVEYAARTGARTVQRHKDRIPVLSLGHLAHMAEVPYQFLRSTISRRIDPYRLFRIRKQGISDTDRYRVICIPDPALLRVQSWIAQNILSTAAPHYASTGFAKGNNIVSAAHIHCNARWLIKLDIKSFFESITEISAYRAFMSLGYQPLVALELARICSRVRSQPGIYVDGRWHARSWKYKIKDYESWQLGYLPQGAPTSPMLSNLSVIAFDEDVDTVASISGLRYSRYADDLTLSVDSGTFSRSKAAKAIGEIYKIMARHGFSPNRTKTQVRPPGARKVVLGLLVDGPKPRLTKEFKSGLRMHLHYLNHPECGPARHAEKRNFDSILGLRSHVRGLIAYAQQVEPDYARGCLEEFDKINW